MIAWLDRLRATSDGRLLFERVSPWLVVLLAGFLRFIDLGNPAKLVFDETYYVKDAWTLWNTGAERAWPADPNPGFESGLVNGFLPDPSFVVHPPLGKWIIGLGMWLGGAENSWSWRLSVAMLGTATVALVFIAAKRLLRSHTWGLVAAFFLAIEGQAIVMSRVALLDGILTFFVLLAFALLLVDRDRLRLRLQQARSRGHELPTTMARPWLLAAGVALGAATAVKWSGLYFIAVFGLYAVGSELLARRRAAMSLPGAALETTAPSQPANGWAIASFKQAWLTALIMLPAALLTYLLSWTGWLVSKTGYDFTSDSNPLIALWNYHRDAYNFHVGLRVPHSYQANPLTWLFMQRPTSMFYEGYGEGEAGCILPSGCASAIDPVPNPLIWYAAAAAILWLAYRWLLERNGQIGTILIGVIAGYLPWLLYLNRTVFQFYTIVFEPWLMIALAFALRHWLQTRSAEKRSASRAAIAFYCVAALALALFFLPVWIGTTIPHWYWQLHMWLPSWI